MWLYIEICIEKYGEPTNVGCAIGEKFFAGNGKLTIVLTGNSTLSDRQYENPVERSENNKLKVTLMWKDIVNYEGYYQISDSGEVKSLSRRINNGSKNGFISKERILKQTKNPNNGYMQVTLMKNRKKKVVYVHSLVAEAFLGENKKATVNHKDGNKQNNHVLNLEYATYSENNQHAYNTGLHAKGEKHYQAKLTREQVAEIRQNGKTAPYYIIALKYGVAPATIRDIIINKTWKN